MNPLEATDLNTICRGRGQWIDGKVAGTLAADPLSSVDTEYPHYVGSVDSADEFTPPREAHPVFFGCFDWHSAVHSHWTLIRLCRLFDDHPARSDIVESIDDRLTGENVECELEYFDANPSFEKPYGWAWLLRLAAELDQWDEPQAETWRQTLEPLEQRILELVESEFLTQTRPFRVGTHQNTAFALAAIHDYALTVGRDDLEAAVAEQATEFYAEDRAYPVEYEPLGWDFLSPALAEADLMRRVYDAERFAEWFDAFVPELQTGSAELLDPFVLESDPGEDVALHLVGLNLSNAWCLAGIAESLADEELSETLGASARAHARRGLDRAFVDEYAGTHWLSTFAVYLLTRNAGGIAP